MSDPNQTECPARAAGIAGALVLGRVIRRQCGYYGLIGNSRRISRFRKEVKRYWLAGLAARPQRETIMSEEPDAPVWPRPGLRGRSTARPLLPSSACSGQRPDRVRVSPRGQAGRDSLGFCLGETVRFVDAGQGSSTASSGTKPHAKHPVYSGKCNAANSNTNSAAAPAKSFKMVSSCRVTNSQSPLPISTILPMVQC